MNNFLNFFKRLFEPAEPIEPLPAGIYHFQAPPENPMNFRLHLRVEPDGTGLLIINAATVLHLNQTATEYAFHLVNQSPEDQAIKIIQQRYNAKFEQIKTDFANLRNQINTLIELPDLDPVTYLNIDRHAPYSENISAPYRLDCALTYRLPENNDPDSAPVKRVSRELNTDEWKIIIQKAWEAGIPHLIFTGGEPTLREDLQELINYSENMGQVTGILTNGLNLGDPTYLRSLLNAGLDHTLIVIQPNNEGSWESLANFSYWSETMDEDLFVAVHLTLTKENQAEFLSLIEKLSQAGVHALSLSTTNGELADYLKAAQEFVYSKDMELIWDIPVPYSELNPIALEFDQEENKVFSGAGRGWLYVEPDGDVLPGQGINQVLGNLLNQEWDVIWTAAKDFWGK